MFLPCLRQEVVVNVIIRSHLRAAKIRSICMSTIAVSLGIALLVSSGWLLSARSYASAFDDCRALNHQTVVGIIAASHGKPADIGSVEAQVCGLVSHDHASDFALNWAIFSLLVFTAFVPAGVAWIFRWNFGPRKRRPENKARENKAWYEFGSDIHRLTRLMRVLLGVFAVVDLELAFTPQLNDMLARLFGA